MTCLVCAKNMGRDAFHRVPKYPFLFERGEVRDAVERVPTSFFLWSNELAFDWK